MKRWLVQHYHALGFTLRRLVRTPVASLLNVIVIGIALSLPAGAYAPGKSAAGFGPGQQRAPDQPVPFPGRGQDRCGKIEAWLKAHSEVKGYRFVHRNQALQI